MRRFIAVLATIAMLLPALAAAQVDQPATVLTAERQIAAAVLPLPEEFRASATVMGYRGRSLEVLRTGDGPMICLADDPWEARFHVACYQKDLEPFMARGRALRAGGMDRATSDSVRNAEVASGALPMPRSAALWSVSAAADSMDWATNTPRGGRHLYVVYLPGATAESTGLPTTPAPNAPWLMFPGTPRAHIMFVPTM